MHGRSEGWWRCEGRHLYPATDTLLITADGGGSNGSRLRLWKLELQGLANETGLVLSICHFPPGTSKWNKIEHRLFSFKGGIHLTQVNVKNHENTINSKTLASHRILHENQAFQRF